MHIEFSASKLAGKIPGTQCKHTFEQKLPEEFVGFLRS
jgi:hypothetical protein